ncbi:MAG TPA: AAA family ATPase [Vicinamibacterales bacterium]|nr:AAA family ATPase [Vicinamibacterales bacterium]
MYEEYYGFVQPPFSLTPDPRFLYRSESHDVALQQVWQAIRRKEGFIVLAGDIGTGKTTLCRTLLEQFDPTTFTALILNPFLSVEELLRELLLSYGVASKDAFRTGRLAAVSKHELVRTLHDFLLSLVTIHGSAVLIIDEAQHLSPEVLEEIRILSNLETNEQKLLQVVLVGQLNLLDLLHDARLRQLDQRVSIRCLLKPLNREEVEAYITHRLWVARGSTVTFTPRAFDLIHAVTTGVPRMINLICDRALMAGYHARTDKIDEEQIHQAAAALGMAVPPGAERREAFVRVASRSVRMGVVVTVAAALALTAAAYYYLGNPVPLLSGADPPAVNAPPVQVLRAAPSPPPAPEAAPSLTPPPAFPGSHAVIVGTFSTPREASAVEQVLRERALPVYALDLRFADGVRRRLLIGRYRSRAEAEKARADIATTFADARVAHWSEESIR